MEGQPRRLTYQEAAVLRAHCQVFSQVGWALFGQMGASLVVQTVILVIAMQLAPDLTENGLFVWALSAGSAYGVGVPLFCCIIKSAPAALPPEEKHPLKPVRFLQVYVMCLGIMYAANFATLFLMWIIGLFRGAPVVNPVDTIEDYPDALNVVLGCVIAPVTEELMFRRLLLRRLRPYGEKFAMFASALCFGLFHGNLNQMFYAFALGLILAYVALKTGCLWQTMLLHAALNAVAVAVIPLLELLGETGDLVLGTLVLGCIFAGAAFLIASFRELRFAPGVYGLRERRNWRLFFENPGMVCFCLLTAVTVASYFLV